MWPAWAIFESFWATDLRTKVAQNIVDFLGYFEKDLFMYLKLLWRLFGQRLETFGLHFYFNIWSHWFHHQHKLTRSNCFLSHNKWHRGCLFGGDTIHCSIGDRSFPCRRFKYKAFTSVKVSTDVSIASSVCVVISYFGKIHYGIGII